MSETLSPSRMFQFTRARGARHSLLSTSTMLFVFQFTRARGARRGREEGGGGVWLVSIHARTGRATMRPWSFAGHRSFNSRAHGARDSIALTS